MIKNKKLKILLNLTILVLILVLLANIDYPMIIKALKDISLPILGLLILLQILTQALLALQWHRLAKCMNYPAGFIKMLISNSYGGFYDSITPGTKVGGELARVLFLKNSMGYDTNQSLSLVAIQKSLSFIALLVLNFFALFSFIHGFTFFKNRIFEFIFFTLILFLISFFLFILFNSKIINSRLQKIRSTNPFLLKIKDSINTFDKATCELKKNKYELFIQVLLSFFIWLLYPIKLYIIVSSFSNVSFLALFPIVFISYFVAILPITPGGLATFEGSMSSMLTLLNIKLYVSIAISIIFRFITFWFVLILSSLVIMTWKFYRLQKVT